MIRLWAKAHVLAVVLAVVLASTALAQTDARTQAQLAIEKLDAAASALTNAPGSRDRVRALIKTVQAYEAGLEALRSGMRNASLRETLLLEELENREAELSRLLGALLVQQRAPEATILLHPAGPLATVHAGMMLAEAAPALEQDTAELRAQLQELRALQQVQRAAREKLIAGLQGVQDARIALSLAIADREELPRRFTSDPEAMRLLLESSETLEGFATALTTQPVGGSATPVQAFSALRGVLALPVRGNILRAFNETDAAGIRRSGMILTTAPRALVTSPVAATVRYQGPLLDYGNVMILEPEKDYLLVLAGLSEVFADIGEVVEPGSALALMGGETRIAQGIDSEIQQDGGNLRSETLYIELRKGNTPVDPAQWFKVKKD